MRTARGRDEMTVSLRQLPENHKLDCDHEHIIECSHCDRKYLVVWDDKEWNFVKDWIQDNRFAPRRCVFSVQLLNLLLHLAAKFQWMRDFVKWLGSPTCPYHHNRSIT